MIERRKQFRTRVIYGAVVDFNALNSTMDCVVRNFTESGARISFAVPVNLPAAFGLTIKNKARTFPARTVWRTALEAGVTFDTAVILPFARPGAASFGDENSR